MAVNNFIEFALAQAKSNGKMTEKQQKIVKTAIQLFAEKGFASTSTSEIAKAAGVAEGTIFRHFGSKENLLFSVIMPFLLDSVPALADDFIKGILTKPYLSFESFLTALIKDRLEFIKENKEIFKILVAELLHRDDFREQLISFFVKSPYQYITTIFDTFKQKGELVDLPNSTLFRTIFIQVFGYFMVRFTLLPNLVWDDSLEVEHLVQVILNGIGKKS